MQKRIPEEWKIGIVKPILKNGKKHDARNDMRLTLMDTGYKIYTEILRSRLEVYLEENKN